MRAYRLAAALMLLASGQASAAAAEVFTKVSGDRPFRPDPAKVYLLLRTTTTEVALVLLRIPTAAETARYEAAKKAAFERDRPGLVEARAKALRDGRTLAVVQASSPTAVAPGVQRTRATAFRRYGSTSTDV